MHCGILIINANGCANECRKKGITLKGIEIPEKRNVVMQQLIRDKSPGIILILESNIQLKKICTEEFGGRNYKSIGEKDAGIIYDTKTFMYVEDPTTRLRQIYESKLIKGESAEIFPRMCARILKGTGVNAQPTLFVCWHGPHKKPIDEKKTLYHDLCLLLSLYAAEKQIPVIVGGDFNLDLYTANDPAFCSSINPVEHHKLIVNNYVANRLNQIDFVLTSKTIANSVDCNASDIFYIIKDLFPELPEIFMKAVFDHDPLVVDVTIPDCRFWLYESLGMNKIGHLLSHSKPVIQTSPFGNQFYHSLPLNKCIQLHLGLSYPLPMNIPHPN